MSDIANFSEKVAKAFELKKQENFLVDSLDKTIKEVFRNNGFHIHNVRIEPKGFSCMANYTSMDYDSLNKINDFFKEKYSLTIEYKECTNILFIFTSL